MAIEKVRDFFRSLGMDDRIMEFDVSSALTQCSLPAEAATAPLSLRWRSWRSIPQPSAGLMSAGFLPENPLKKK